MNKGFTLIEMLVVTGITVLITAALITGFSRSRVDLNGAALSSLDAVRETQTDAQSGMIFQGVSRCGFGIHFTQTGYIIFAGFNASAVDCTVQSRIYDPDNYPIVRQADLADTNLEYVPSLNSDIFFEPPNPTTYIGGSSTVGASTTISVRIKGATCGGSSTDCKTIYVTTSGQSQLQ